MSDTDIQLNVDVPVATIAIVTDGGLNVGSSGMMRKFSEVVAQVAENGQVRATVIRGEGKVFLAGADIKEMTTFDREKALEYGRLGQKVLDAIESLPSISVAAINGAAMGGGMELALACDFRIAVKSAKIGLPESSLGLIPGWGGIIRATRLIGPSRAKKLYLSALPVSAEEGLEFGLVDEIVNAQEDLGPRVAAFCKSFRRGAPAAVALAKRASRDGDDLNAFADCFTTDDAREGMRAFVEKRPARWME